MGEVDQSLEQRRERMADFKSYACSDHDKPQEGCAACFHLWEKRHKSTPEPADAP